MVYGYLLTHGIHWVFRVATFPEAFKAFAENIPILAKKTHHSWIRHLLLTRRLPPNTAWELVCASLLWVLVLKTYNP